MSLHQQLQSLHRQLHELTELDQDTRQQLLILQADINRLLDDEAPSSSAAAAVEALAARFDADHPSLSSALRSVVDTLGKAGI